MNKEDKQGKIIIAIILVMIALITMRIHYCITEKNKTYEYATNCEIGKSKNCYLKEDIGYCEVDNKAIRVDNYYEVR